MRALKSLILLTLTLSTFTACSSKTEKAEQDPFVTKEGSTITTKQIEYKAGDKTMKGYLAVPEGEGPFPGVLVVHEWWGQTEYPRERARQLARAGYMAFAVDMYGDGQTADHPDNAKKFAKKVMADMDMTEASFKAALATLKKQEKVDSNNIAAMGYCFGGAVVLEMARRGSDLKMVASYHGDLTPLVKNEVSPVKTRVLIFHGTDDAFVPQKALFTARNKLKAANIRYRIMRFKNAKHGFTNPEATANGEKFGIPLAYDKAADEKSWEETLKAFKIVFK